jgi:hypothetical protein
VKFRAAHLIAIDPSFGSFRLSAAFSTPRHDSSAHMARGPSLGYLALL